MGRLAGPVGRRSQVAYEAHQRMWEEHRRHIAAITPVVHPPAVRRQTALLWYVADRFHGEMMIGWRGSPPLTRDMRALIDKRYLILKRLSFENDTYFPPRTNWIVVTPTGAGVLARATISDNDKHYIEMAMKTGVVR
ncbi:hypothetical protein [Rhizobium sp. LjRoot254]|uniref:hypothetical protein n=1 Tax=Rhizobium sp. LjRoot254 TaxID=3342297 RepID=UPI003ECF2008